MVLDEKDGDDEIWVKLFKVFKVKKKFQYLIKKFKFRICDQVFIID